MFMLPEYAALLFIFLKMSFAFIQFKLLFPLPTAHAVLFYYPDPDMAAGPILELLVPLTPHISF